MTTSLQNLIGRLVESPRLKLVVDELSLRLREEEIARKRFERTASEDVRAEFIAGKVIEQMPTRKEHTDIVRWISEVIHTFIRLRNRGAILTEQAIIKTGRNNYVPDLCFWPSSIASGFTKKQATFPVPAMVVEVVSPDTESRDRGVKFEDYAAHGVVEYWIVDPGKEVIEQYRNVEGEFKLVKKHKAGSIKSIAIKGFSMPVRAAFDEATNARCLRRMWAK